MSERSMAAAFSSDARGLSSAKGLYALGILSHEASIIAAKERAEMKTMESFILRKLPLTALDIQSRHSCAVKRAESGDQIAERLSVIR